MKLNKGQKIGLVGGIIALVGFFLPWVTLHLTGDIATSAGVTQQSFMGIQSGGVMGLIALVSAILVIVFSVINKSSMPILTIVFAIIGLLLVLLAMTGVQSLIDATRALASATGTGDITASYEYGLWVTIIGFIIGLVGGGLSMKEMKASAVPPAMPPEEPQQF